MRLLVATKEGQGERKSDFCFCDGETVILGTECETDQEVDGACGCRRSLIGLVTRKATTTCVVAETPYADMEQFALIVLCSERAVGFKTSFRRAVSIAERVAEVAKRLPLGTILEYRDGRFAVRKRSGGVADARPTTQV